MLLTLQSKLLFIDEFSLDVAAVWQMAVWIIALHGLLFLGSKLVVKPVSTGLGVVTLTWVFYEYSAYFVQLWLLQTCD